MVVVDHPYYYGDDYRIHCEDLPSIHMLVVVLNVAHCGVKWVLLGVYNLCSII